MHSIITWDEFNWNWNNLSNIYTVLTIIVATALIQFSHNFGQNLLSKMRLLIKLRLFFKSGCYYSRYGKICHQIVKIKVLIFIKNLYTLLFTQLRTKKNYIRSHIFFSKHDFWLFYNHALPVLSLKKFSIIERITFWNILQSAENITYFVTQPQNRIKWLFENYVQDAFMQQQRST